MPELSGLEEQHHELATLLGGLAPADWERPTRCEGWSVADVVLHLSQTDELGLASLAGRLSEAVRARAVRTGAAAGFADVDEGAAAMVAAERGAPAPELLARWRGSADAVRAAIAAADPHLRVQWVAGQLSVRTLTVTRLAEAWIHTGDVAEAMGVALAPAERLRHVARLAWRTLPYAFSRAGAGLSGPVAFQLVGPGGAPWVFRPDAEPATVIEGDGVELCLVAGRRVEPEATSLRGRGPDARAVLELVRTYA